MIIRIMGEGQFTVPEDLKKELNSIDNQIVDHVARGDEASFRADLLRLHKTILKKGRPLDPNEIRESDVILPPSDLTIEEAKRIFSGSGLIEG